MGSRVRRAALRLSFTSTCSVAAETAADDLPRASAWCHAIGSANQQIRGCDRPTRPLAQAAARFYSARRMRSQGREADLPNILETNEHNVIDRFDTSWWAWLDVASRNRRREKPQ